MSKEDIKVLLKSSRPILFQKHVTEWPLIYLNIENWSKKFQSKKLPIRVGRKTGSAPQWERTCKVFEMYFDEFLKTFNESDKEWAYFDYKYMHEWFDDDMNSMFDWTMFGVDQKGCKDSTLWIGTADAHTPCHYDAYSFNLVAQIYGRKRWVLIPPDNTDSMRPTRIPYEESSIYSKLDFYSPKNIDDFKAIKGAIIITLEPGDVLYVPKHWWHFVENIDLAISINTWVPMKCDEGNRLEESLVRMFISTTIGDSIYKEMILNPNEDDITKENSIQYLSYFAKNENLTLNLDPKDVLVQEDYCEEIAQKYKSIKILHENTKSCFEKFIENNSKRHIKSNDKNDDTNLKLIVSVINSFCHPQVINLVKKQFVEQINK